MVGRLCSCGTPAGVRSTTGGGKPGGAGGNKGGGERAGGLWPPPPPPPFVPRGGSNAAPREGGNVGFWRNRGGCCIDYGRVTADGTGEQRGSEERLCDWSTAALG